MFQELNSEPLSFARTWDESGDIFDGNSSTFVFHDSEIRNQCSKWIIRYFWSDAGNCCDEGGFSSIGEADETDIRNELEFEFYFFCLSLVSQLSKRRSLSGA